MEKGGLGPDPSPGQGRRGALGRCGLDASMPPSLPRETPEASPLNRTIVDWEA